MSGNYPSLKMHSITCFYDASFRWYIQVGPIKDGMNWYGYCSNNPINYVDPTGLEGKSDDLEHFKTEDSIQNWEFDFFVYKMDVLFEVKPRNESEQNEFYSSIEIPDFAYTEEHVKQVQQDFLDLDLQVIEKRTEVKD